MSRNCLTLPISDFANRPNVFRTCSATVCSIPRTSVLAYSVQTMRLPIARRRIFRQRFVDHLFPVAHS
jgi:hypothetical protein